MRRAFLPLLPALLAWGCDATEPSVPATVVLSPNDFAFDAIGSRDTVIAEVLDQRGNAMDGVPLTWSAEGSAVTIEPLGGDSAVVISAGNGSAIVRATVGGEITGEAAATVVQQASIIYGIQGMGQRRVVGSTLPAPIVVAVRDRRGYPVSGVAVAFSVTRGNGSLSATEAITGESGTAEVSWTIGTSTSSGQELTATAEGVEDPAVIAAAAAPDAVSEIVIVRGQDQSTSSLGRVTVEPTVRVADRFGNPVPSIQVSFQVIQGGGTVYGGSGQTDSAGERSVLGWALGFESGLNILRASVPSTALSVDFRATAIAPPTISVNAGAEQAAMVNTSLPTRPSFIVRDGSRNPMSGVEVTFTVTEGGGTLSAQTGVTDSNGIVSPGDWTMGPVGSRNRLTARAILPDMVNSSATLDAYGCEGGGGAGYAITLCFASAISPTQQQVFQTAAARWSDAIIGDLPNVNVDLSEPCPGSPSIRTSVDDLLIFVSVIYIDGPGGVLGQAGPCRVRGAGFLPYVGLMQFDQSDVEFIGSTSLQAIILHEMAHVIGVGTLWDNLDLVVDPSTASVKLDSYYSGAAGLAGFDAIGGTAYTGGQKVPVENEGGQGTRNSHWRESVLRNELMTGFINSGANPLSLLTIRSLEDLGYAVNPATADPFTYTPPAALRSSQSPGETLQLVDDILDIPLWQSDTSGREVRVR